MSEQQKWSESSVDRERREEAAVSTQTPLPWTRSVPMRTWLSVHYTKYLLSQLFSYLSSQTPPSFANATWGHIAVIMATGRRLQLHASWPECLSVRRRDLFCTPRKCEDATGIKYQWWCPGALWTNSSVHFTELPLATHCSPWHSSLSYCQIIAYPRDLCFSGSLGRN